MKKVKAFTLSELLVVMIVSAIVISISFLVLSMVQKQAKGIKSSIEIKSKIETLDKLLWKDFNDCDKVVLEKKKLLVFKTIDTVIYKLREDFIIREQDSFKLSIGSVTYLLDGEKALKGEIDALKIEFIEKFKYNSIFVYREKDAAFYLNN